MVSEVRELSIERLAEGGPYPIEVIFGQTVRVYKAVFAYRGPAKTLYLHWGLKAAYADFNNGANLEARRYAWAAVDVPKAADWLTLTRTITADLLITSDMRTGRTYDTYIWMATFIGPSPDTEFLVIDTDTSVVKIVAAVVVPPAEVRDLQVAYSKV